MDNAMLSSIYIDRTCCYLLTVLYWDLGSETVRSNLVAVVSSHRCIVVAIATPVYMLFLSRKYL